ncbi:MAG: phosphotransferase [Candidatus Omnitrophota bacterium]
MICLSCPNGCHLSVVYESSHHVRIEGNKCDKGIAFAHAYLRNAGAQNLKIIRSEIKPVIDPEMLISLCACWGIKFKTTRPGLIPAGSPERTLFRIVIEDEQADLWAIEKIRPAAFQAKLKIIKTLDYLSRRGFSKVTPYLTGVNGLPIQEYASGLWQMVSFLPGEELDRQSYMFDGWRAGVLSDVLIKIREYSADIPFYCHEERFSIKEYIYNLKSQINVHRHELVPGITPVISFLEKEFMVRYDSLDFSFCHGDFHPMNVIWGKNDIKTVIDWEFAGLKPEMYDLANMVGCLGIEHPSCLMREMVSDLIRQLQKAGIYEERSWTYFLELVISLRFAWLSEWLRKRDQDMIDMELEYMHLLLDNRIEILSHWGIDCK